jgi:hypothetical protein
MALFGDLTRNLTEREAAKLAAYRPGVPHPTMGPKPRGWPRDPFKAPSPPESSPPEVGPLRPPPPTDASDSPRFAYRQGVMTAKERERQRRD